MMDEFARCPYRPPHSLIHHRLLKHIFKCEEKYPPLQVCPFNNSHILKTKGDVKKHLVKCPSKKENKDSTEQEDQTSYVVQQVTENADGSFTVVLCRNPKYHYCPSL